MGYDKPDLAFCVHLGSPASPVAYYQQVGRAGRALEDAQAILVPAESDERIWDYFATSEIPDEQQVERILDALGDSAQSLPGLEAATGIRRGRLEALLKILAVDDAVRRESGGWTGTGRPWYFDEQKWNVLRAVRAAEAGLMRSYAHGDGCLMQFLQQALDDPDPQPCGRCSLCTGTLPAPGARPSGDVVEAARRYFRGQDVVVEPRKMWPSGLPDRKGKIRFLAPGRALAFADDPAWDDELAALSQRDGPASPVIIDGLVEVLRRWSRSWERPVAVVGMPSRRYPTLVRSVAEHIAWPAPAGPRAHNQRAPAGGRRRLGRTGQGPALPHRSRARGRRHDSYAVDSDRGGSLTRRCGSNLGAAAGHPSAAVADCANPFRGPVTPPRPALTRGVRAAG
jgi:ATP-dependent DNA helicase RecQ